MGIRRHPLHPRTGHRTAHDPERTLVRPCRADFGDGYHVIEDALNARTVLNFELNTLDDLHYSKADHAKLADAAAKKIREMLE